MHPAINDGYLNVNLNKRDISNWFVLVAQNTYTWQKGAVTAGFAQSMKKAVVAGLSDYGNHILMFLLEKLGCITAC